MKTQTFTQVQRRISNRPTRGNVFRLFFLLLVIGFNYANAQTPTWVTISTVNNVTISYQQSSCQGEDKLYLKVENNNPAAVTVSWTLWGTSTAAKMLHLEASETKQGECNIASIVELNEVIPIGKTIADMVANITVN